jgi:hypothetical protein
MPVITSCKDSAVADGLLNESLGFDLRNFNRIYEINKKCRQSSLIANSFSFDIV